MFLFSLLSLIVEFPTKTTILWSTDKTFFFKIVDDSFHFREEDFTEHTMRQPTISSFFPCISSTSPKTRTYSHKKMAYIRILRDVTNTLEDTTSYPPHAKRRRFNSCASADSAQDMDTDESSNMSDMSIELEGDLDVQDSEIRNIDEGASLEENPEYAEDIDNHLRKMEVRIFNFPLNLSRIFRSKLL
jgi:hypothetical protein